MAKKTPPAASKQPSRAGRADIILCLQDDPTNSPFPAQDCRTRSWVRLALVRLARRGGSPRGGEGARLSSEVSRIAAWTLSAAQRGADVLPGRAASFQAWPRRAGAGRTAAQNATPRPARTSALLALGAPLGRGRVGATRSQA